MNHGPPHSSLFFINLGREDLENQIKPFPYDLFDVFMYV